MLDLSQPDQVLTPAQKQRQRRSRTYAILAVEISILLCFKGADWARLLQAKAALLGVPWLVIVLGWLAGIPLLYLLLVFVHESGHVTGALLARFRILAFVASGLQITRKAKGWQLRWLKPPAKLGGMVQASPNHVRNLRSRYSLLILGGPVANLLTGALALYLHQRLAAAPAFSLSAAGYLLTNALLAFGWMSVVIGGLNLLPFNTTSGHISDGKHLWNFLRGGVAMHQHLGLLQLQSLTYAGVRPREWNPALVEQLLAHRSQTVLDFYAHLYAYSYFHDCNELEPLRLHLNEALDRRQTAPVALQQYLLTEAAYIAALQTHNPEQARYWLNYAQEVKPFTKEDALFAQAAVAYAEGRLSEAATWLQAARQQLQDTITTGGSTPAAERMTDLQVRLEQARLQAA